MLVILSGVAGAGKDTVKREIVKRMSKVNTIPSYTTREMRPGDVPGETYIFVSKEQFEEMIQNKEVYEYDIHHNHYYGASKRYIQEKAKEGIVIKDYDVNGTQNLVNILKGDIKVVTIFLRVPKEELERRLKARIDRPSKEEIALRLSRFDYEESKIANYDYVIHNDDLEKTIAIVQAIIENEEKRLKKIESSSLE